MIQNLTPSTILVRQCDIRISMIDPYIKWQKVARFKSYVPFIYSFYILQEFVFFVKQLFVGSASFLF